MAANVPGKFKSDCNLGVAGRPWSYIISAPAPASWLILY